MVNAQTIPSTNTPTDSPQPSIKSLEPLKHHPRSTHSDPSSSDSASISESAGGPGSATGSPADTLVDSQVLDGPVKVGSDQDKAIEAIDGRRDVQVNGGGAPGMGMGYKHAEVQRMAAAVGQLHRFCGEGNVMGVRSILSQNLELVETIDTTTGWTPMLSAIYADQPDVVRELLLAGAYPPPPSVTSDPLILSLLYPQIGQTSAHLIAPSFAAQALPPMAFPGASPTSPDFSTFGGHGHHPHHLPPNGHFRMNGHSEARGKSGLPPIEVSKSIPCKNFPNCRFGEACLFRHPGQPFYGQPSNGPGSEFSNGPQAFPPQPYSPTASAGQFAPSAQNGQHPRSFAMDGQAAVFQPQQQNAPNGRSPTGQKSPGPPVPGSSDSPGPTPANDSTLAPTSASTPAQDSQPLSAITPASDIEVPTVSSPSASTQNVALPSVSSVSSVTAPNTIYNPAQTLSNPVLPNGISQQLPLRPNGLPALPFGMNGEYARKPFHAKKMSFNGGKGPNWGQMGDRSSHLGSWTNGVPPPCVFFQANKCRNGDMCKFPHMNVEGVDCRHPDVINGTLPPVGSQPNPMQNPRPRGRASFGGNFGQMGMGPPHPNFVAMQKAQFAQARLDSAAGHKLAPVKDAEQKDEGAKKVDTPAQTTETGPLEAVASAAGRSLSASNAASKSVPNTRAGSPNSSSAANGRIPHTGRQSHPSANGTSARSSSMAPTAKEISQKVPSAADFPTFGGSTNNASSGSGWAGKMTLAQVLTAPAPVKAVMEETSAPKDQPEASGSAGNAAQEEKTKSGEAPEQSAPAAGPSAKPRRKIPSLKNAMDVVKRRTTISAPGKVLVTGGYLVLDPKYTGTVFAASSRFYTSIASIEMKVGSPSSPGIGSVIVTSPQFLSAEWTYKVDTTADLTVEQSGSASGGRNKFVELALRETLRLVSAFKGNEGIAQLFAGEPRGNFLKITIAGDNNFYSQRQALSNLSLPLVSASLVKIPDFNSLGTTLADVHKTGMGSSAALITSLVAAILVHCGVVDESGLSKSGSELEEHSSPNSPLEGKQARDLIHNTAQYVHCLAQGKVGSGFDVSSAVYGSQIYRKFDAGAIEHLMVEDGVPASELKASLLPSERWTNSYSPVRLPPGVRLFLADVDAGSDTPSLVGKVLEWRKDKPEEANAIWDSLAGHNSRFASILARLCDYAGENDGSTYNAVIDAFVDAENAEPLDGHKQEILGAFHDLVTVMKAIRGEMREMGTLAGVPIEPDEQSKLLDACSALPGVIGGGVPGAGGYDALHLLVITRSPSVHNGYVDSGAILTRVEELFLSWNELSLCPLSCGADDEGGLKSHPNPNEVKGLAAVVGAPPYFSVSM